jgi:hypothetical protein
MSKIILRDSGNGEALDFTVEPSRSFHLHEIRLSIPEGSGATSGDLTALLISPEKVVWDVEAEDPEDPPVPTDFRVFDFQLIKEDISSKTEYHYACVAPVFIPTGGKIQLEWPNANDAQWGLEVVISTL